MLPCLPQPTILPPGHVSHFRRSIFTVPVELAQHILSFCHPWDVATFSQTSRAAYALVYHPTDQYLWRQLFAAYPFDSPHSIADIACKREKVDWKGELTSRMKVERVLFDGPMTSSDKQHVLRTLVTVIEDSSWAASQYRSDCNIKWLKRLVQHSSLLHNIYSVPETQDDAQDYARLRAYLALSVIDDRHNMPAHMKLLDRRDYSRAYVYNLLNYTAENNWGPIRQDGSVDWIHAEHLVNVVALNIRELPGNWAKTRPPTCMEGPRTSSFSSIRDFDDWAGVEGTR
ncbi:hypothetical protein JR316_0000753 [Psilocybe cubensis]|uniref:Uncharacterized protein n=2 Tax=Psilocybe cubensis TaxID=181762 RepID=A0ACB8HFW8_PSICU|nr:hypothetical protein JR316_0000753 [Psilocybe cubensis]KAH9486688.1 hypothetical protein JR316_0000753 [Psilocybe cubensis]